MKLNLLKKMMLFILLPTILGLAILAFIAGFSSTNSFTKVNNTQLSELVRIQASEINNIITYIEGVTASYGEDPLLQEFVKTYNTDPESESTLEMQNELNKYLQLIADIYRDISLSFIVDKKGIAVANSRPQLIGLDVSNYETVKEGFRGQSAIEVRKSLETGEFAAFISYPLRYNNVIEGVFVIRVDLLALNKATLSAIKLTDNMTTYIYDKDFNIVMDNLNQYIGDNDGALPYVREMAQKKQGIINIDYEGEPLIAFYSYIEAANWILVIDIPHNEFYESVSALEVQIYLIALSIIAAISIIIFLVAKGISSGLQKASAISTYVAEGNLVLTSAMQQEVNIYSLRADELGDLARGLDVMISKMASMVNEAKEATEEAKKAVAKAEIAQNEANEAAEKASKARREGLLDAARQLEDVVNIVASASEELSTQIELSSNSVQDQAHRIASTATAMEEMNSTVIDVASNSSHSAQVTENTKQKAIAGAQITEKCKISISAVQEESIKLRKNMNALSEHAQSINTVMSVITDIADQTNLLALNAAIEAARAGEAGRGFAVVADEVRKLAEKTITSTTDVANAIHAIQESTDSNVKQVDIAVQRIEEATNLATQSGEALRDILEMADVSAAGVSAIATASEEQSFTVREMTTSIDQINEIANKTNNAMLEAAEAVVSLSAQTQELTNIIESLKK